MKLITALGLDYRILIAQFLNFAILLFVLWRFAYRPVFNILEERRAKIAKGLDDGVEAEKKLLEAQDDKKEIVALAKKEANEIIEEAKKKAEIRYQEIVDKSKADIKIIINGEKEKIATERNFAIKEIKKEAASMIALALAKILPEKTDAKTDAEMITKVLKEME